LKQMNEMSLSDQNIPAKHDWNVSAKKNRAPEASENIGLAKLILSYFFHCSSALMLLYLYVNSDGNPSKKKALKTKACGQVQEKRHGAKLYKSFY